MPLYLYRCPYCEHERYVRHSVHDPATVLCESCGGAQVRKPQQVLVNWNGNKPSDGGVSDYVNTLINEAPERREDMAARKELEDAV